MNILLIEPFFTGSHARWAEGYAQHSAHEIELMTLPGRHWKWRMHGSAVTFAQQILEKKELPDLILATDMLDVAVFRALTRDRLQGIPLVLYMHENQLTYPWSPTDVDPAQKRDRHYGFINYTSALAADWICFNSAYHRAAFLDALPEFLRGFPDHRELDMVTGIEKKSQVLSLGLDLKNLDTYKSTVHIDSDIPLILWNHRWEYDKDPDTFFSVLMDIATQGIPFRLAVLGESYGRKPDAFKKGKGELGNRIVHWGYATDRAAYARYLWEADILPVTARHDFFGTSVVEAIYCGCDPLLPDRLAYPEHIPKAQRSEHFYTTPEELTQQLAHRLIEGRKKIASDLRSFVAKYDWTQMVSVYDAVMDDLFL